MLAAFHHLAQQRWPLYPTKQTLHNPDPAQVVHTCGTPVPTPWNLSAVQGKVTPSHRHHKLLRATGAPQLVMWHTLTLTPTVLSNPRTLYSVSSKGLFPYPLRELGNQEPIVDRPVLNSLYPRPHIQSFWSPPPSCPALHAPSPALRSTSLLGSRVKAAALGSEPPLK